VSKCSAERSASLAGTLAEARLPSAHGKHKACVYCFDRGYWINFATHSHPNGPGLAPGHALSPPPAGLPLTG
jgi:hypothetical protein